MGKGKGKRKFNIPAKENQLPSSNPLSSSASKKNDQSLIDQTKSSVNSKGNLSQDLHCEICEIQKETSVWFVQCDVCDLHFHFECVGFSKVDEDCPWSCPQCFKKGEEPIKEKSVNQSNRKKRPTNVSKAKFSNSLSCNLCENKNKEAQWFVQCDDCDHYFHFTCCQITELYEEEPWSCNKCNQSKSTNKDQIDQSEASVNNELITTIQSSFNEPSTTIQSSINEISTTIQSSLNETHSTTSQLNQMVTPIIVEADVHAERSPRLEDVIENVENPNTIGNQVQQIVDQSKGRASTNLSQFDDRTNVKKSSTRVASLNPKSASNSTSSKTRTSSSNTRSTSSSKRLERVQAEFDLQKQIDEDRLLAMKIRMNAEVALEKAKAEETLKLEELNLRQKREQKLLEGKTKSIGSNYGSNRSTISVDTNRTSYVSDWIKNQKDRTKLIPVDVNVQDNIPVEPIKPTKAKSALDVPTFTKKINRLSFDSLDWSLTLNEDEQDLLTKLLRKQVKPEEASTTQDIQSKECCGTLNADASIFNPNLQTCTNSNNVPHVPPLSMASNPQSLSVCNTRPTFSHPLMVMTTSSYDATKQSKDQGHDTKHWRGQTQSTQLIQNQTNLSHGTTKPPKYQDHHTSHWAGQSQSQSTQFTQNERTTSGQTFTKFSNPIISTCGSGQQTNDQVYSTSNNHAGPINYGAPRNSGNMPYSRQMALTAEQIAARQVMGKTPLPYFYGSPSEWQRFISKYESSTFHCCFSDVENLDRLDKCIQGKAREIVKCQLNMPQCVPEIIDTLRQKYGRPEIIIKSLLTEIRNQPAIKPDKLESLSDYGYHVRNMCRTIQSLNMNYHLYNPELAQELIDKLPPQIKIDWARHSETFPQTSLIDLSDWLYKLSNSLNRITMPEIMTSNEQKLERKHASSKSENSKNGFVHIHDGSANKEVKDSRKLDSQKSDKKCVTCGNSCKFVGECPRFKGLAVDERWSTIIENKICQRCLGRHGGSCRKSKECGVNGCKAKHHPFMHNDTKRSKFSQSLSSRSKMVNDSTLPAVTGASNTHCADDPDTLSRIVPVKVHNNNKSFLTFAFLDEGSHFTLMERHVANKIGLRGTPETICLLWTKKVHRQEKSELANLEISGVNVEPTKMYPIRSVNIVDDLNLPIQSLNQTKMIQRFPHLKDLPLLQYENITPTMIIGLKHARLSTPLETIEGEENDPIATRSRLGWSIHGPINHTSTGYVNVHRVTKCLCQDRDDDLHNMIKEHFTVENFGVTASSMSLESKENELALELLKKGTLRQGTRFETRLLWKNEACELPDSYPMAVKRLSCLENKGPKVINTINDFVNDYIEKGYVSKLSSVKTAQTSNRTWYLPIFTVVHPKKPDKLRPVFDGAARVKGISLNSALYTGPDLLVSIVEVLRRFREHKIAICGDIKEMYHQVSVHVDDRQSQRFLWRNGEKNRVPDIYVMNVMTFGATCSPSAAQFVKNINALEFQKEYPRAAEAIIKNHYVDDLMDGAKSVKDAIQLVNDVKFIHSQGGFEIRNFKSNSVELLKAIGEPVIANEKIPVENESLIERVLGMFWNTRLDCFTYSLKFTKVSSEILIGKQLPTKREALRLLMSIFDPLGLLSYYLIHLKILIQDVWRTQAKWDDQISEELREIWIRWVEILPNVTKLEIPRCYSINLSENIRKKVEIHVFVDAGEDAFAAVAYLKIETNESCECALIGSKAKVAPLKYLSIPRKELQAAVLGTRLLSSIIANQSFTVDRRIIWSDSETVLSWLKSNSRKYTQFVAHRVGEILETSDVHEWRWVPTKENVADEATKWSKTPTFSSSDRWFKGPEFILQSEGNWPEKKNIKSNVKEEMKAHFAHSRFVIPRVINPENFSKWNRMVRAVAYAIWFIAKRRTRTDSLSQEEISRAEALIFRQAQFEGYPAEMVILERNRILPIDKQEFIEKPSPLYDGSPYLDGKGVLRMKWRIDGARELSYDTRRPIILPREGRITMLLVHLYHVKYFHQNHETVFNEINQRFYIPRLRSVIKKVRKSCQMCKVKLAKVMEPQMGDLPFARLATGFRPFSFVGIDYFGPMYVKIGRRKEKRWGVLFTCLTIRAVHMELANSLDTNECILCIRNHITTHGIPIEIHSDNGSNLKGADNELQRERKKIDDTQLRERFTDSYTKWIFTAPTAAHMGGSWERLIRSVKSGLYQILPTRTPSESMLRNILKEVSNVINSRPLTYIPLESYEDEPLTPNHFLLGSSNGYKPPCKLNLDGPYLRKSWKESQRLTELFWKRFIREYLPTITRRTKWFKQVKPLAPGDLVLIVDPENPRNTYPMARVSEVQMGSNGQVRRAKVETILEAKTNAKGNISKVRKNALWRPAHKLAVLDVAPIIENGLAQSQLNQLQVDRETGGSVGASVLNLNSGIIGARNETSTVDETKSKNIEYSNVN